MDADAQLKRDFILYFLHLPSLIHILHNFYSSIYNVTGMFRIGNRQAADAEVCIADGFYFLNLVILQNMIEGTEAGMDFHNKNFGAQLFTNKCEVNEVGEHDGDITERSCTGSARLLQLVGYFRRENVQQ